MEMEMLATASMSGERMAILWQSDTPWLVLPERFTRGDIFKHAAEESAKRGWPVAPRKTGGGITPQGPGVLNLALCFTAASGQSRAIIESYAKIVDPLTQAFADLGLSADATAVHGSFCDGDYNLAIAGRKLVGTAQRWRGTTCLIHALILTDINLAPAVDAVARLSRDLDHDTVFRHDAHCRLADLCADKSDITQQTAIAIARAITSAGYAAYAP
jgi:lipoate-protein ligase A